ncbi:hypothetical protein GCM10007424_09700 [Flavobacterium suaedae]|uniref:T9SS type A sorting domain-containing protein n=2 Tax=Flavobacterium suaedae TaxID=1767027 RepID=A0ABQ1JL31_9FLAO|nr:hypothetical protein GCM10007424_09700 [Flavobacterium suaedae]
MVMKKILPVLFILLSAVASAQIVNIPDANFKNKLLDANTVNNIAFNSDNEPMVIDINGDYEIQVSEAEAVWSLDLYYSGINSLQGIEEFVNLRSLVCSSNAITNLPLGNLVNLESIDCSNTGITALDLSEAPNLASFTVDNCAALQHINIKNGAFLVSPELCTASNTNNLTYICIDENEETVLTGWFTSLIQNTYCSFTPGGDYNTINGAVSFDLDNNGCDASDGVQAFVKLNINDGTNEYSVFTNTAGEYNYYTGAGNYTVTPSFENETSFTISPASGAANFPVVDNSVSTHNFCITPAGTQNDIEVIMEPITQAQPGQNVTYKIVYKNIGNTTASGSVSCNWDADLLEYVYINPMADVIGTGTYTWNYTDLKPLENREITMILNVNNTISVGDVMPFSASGDVAGGDANPSDNYFELDQRVVSTYNFNNITCIQGETVPSENIGEYLHYVVTFTNTGISDADNIVVRHQLDESQFDLSTLQLINSSHDVQARVEEGIAEFIFKDVTMATEDHGNILFKVKTRPSLMVNDVVTNSAEIFFDYNEPLTTNNANTTFETLKANVYQLDKSVKLYPNPAKNKVQVSADTQINTIEVFDIQGRLLYSIPAGSSEHEIDMSKRSSGIYFVRIITEFGSTVEKLVIE